MKPAKMLEELEEIAPTLGVKVSYEKLDSSVGVGGMCRVKGKLRIIVDKRATTHERLATLGAGLSTLDVAETKLSKPVRQLFAYYQQQAQQLQQLRAAS